MEFLRIDDFKFRDKFIDLTDAQLSNALQIINAQFSGVYTLWGFLSPGDAQAKRELCINYLIAWQLAILYPEQALDVSGTGSMPLSSKKVGPIFIKYKDMVRQSGSGLLDMLTCNQWGLQALTLIQSAPEMYMVFA